MSRHRLLTSTAPVTPLVEHFRVLSVGWVADIVPSGPILAPRSERVIQTADPDLFIPAMSRRAQRTLNLLSLIWVLTVIGFGVWWFQPEHVGTPLGLIINSIVVAFMLLLPAAFVSRLRHIRRINPETPLPDLRVAMITTRAPSEPFSEVRPTLEAMLSQDTSISYDVWLADEAPTEDILEWCETHRVKVSTRAGVNAYHRTEWPRRTRCKEGNLAYFYDSHGYRDYDVVAQFDCDHVPEPGYLEAILRPFSDPAVGYVAAPSMCDANRAESWAGRGRLYAEAMVHGAHQAAHNGGLTPTCIGSHYAVRTAALARAGGLGPELAEDFSTSYVIRLTGADGAFAVDARAHGQGPPTFAAMVTQEFQWCRSLVVLLFSLVGRTLGVFSPRLHFRFLFALLIMPLMGLMTGAGFLIAPAAVVFNQQWMSMNFLVFILLTSVVSVPLVLMMWVLRRADLLRPHDIPLINWESGLFQLVRWPFVVHGLIAGIQQLVLRRQVNFRVTPKGSTELVPIAVKVVMPYYVLALSMTAIGVWGTLAERAVGYAGLTLLGAVTYGFVSFFVPWMHLRELPAGLGTRRERFAAVRAPLLSGVVVFLLSLVGLALFISVFFGGFQWIR